MTATYLLRNSEILSNSTDDLSGQLTALLNDLTELQRRASEDENVIFRAAMVANESIDLGTRLQERIRMANVSVGRGKGCGLAVHG